MNILQINIIKIIIKLNLLRMEYLWNNYRPFSTTRMAFFLKRIINETKIMISNGLPKKQGFYDPSEETRQLWNWICGPDKGD